MTPPRSAPAPALAVVGATGAVGSVVLQILSQRADVWGDIRLIASGRSAGRMLTVRGEESEVLALTEDAFDGIGPGDVVLFLTPAEVSARWAPVVVTRGAVAVDQSAAFREDAEVPLVVPCVNAQAVRMRPRGIVASPDCVTAAMIAALGALHAEYALADPDRVLVPGRERGRTGRFRGAAPPAVAGRRHLPGGAHRGRAPRRG
ncbi:Semialdehyde dehydrogenase NAD - binding protein [Actinobacteria bacterium OV450]|nr:Semialdehyde dehydrogenase NAD - binding protein [Actinobacteria bacterium OV450]